MNRPARSAACCLLAAAAAAAGCAPALDWRDWRPAGFPLQMQLPCKPDSQRRPVPLAGATVALTLHACDAAGQTFALGAGDVGDPARVGPVLDALAEAAVRNIGAEPAPGQPWQPAGATPHAAARRLAAQGRRPDGRPLRLVLGVFSHGTVVFQATAMGETLSDEAVEAFFASVRAGQ